MADNSTVIDILMDKISVHLRNIRKLSKEEIIKVVQELQKEPAIWNEIAGPNRERMAGFLANPTDTNYRIVVNILAETIPHRTGFIVYAMKEKRLIKGNDLWDAVLEAKLDITKLNTKQLVEFLRDWVNNTRLRELPTFARSYMGSYPHMQKALADYDAKHILDGEDNALAWFKREREEGILNLFSQLIPNLMGALARHIP